MRDKLEVLLIGKQTFDQNLINNFSQSNVGRSWSLSTDFRMIGTERDGDIQSHYYKGPI